MFRHLFLPLLTTALALPAIAQTTPAWEPAPGHQTITLWPNGAPGGQPNPGPEKDAGGPLDAVGRTVLRLTNVSSPTITLYPPPKGQETGAAVVVFPGGGYNLLAIDKEGTEICAWLNSIGVTAILLKYRVPDSGPYPKSSAALQDAQRAVGLVRAHAADWHIDPHRIGVLGFSAGAHLAAALSNQYESRIYSPVDAADKVSCRPDFAVIIYPGYLAQPGSSALNPAIKIDPDGPPVFLLQAEDDPVRVENSLAYYLALKNAKIPVEMHLYAVGGHGYGLRSPANLPIHTWPQTVNVWFHTIGVLIPAG